MIGEPNKPMANVLTINTPKIRIEIIYIFITNEDKTTRRVSNKYVVKSDSTYLAKLDLTYVSKLEYINTSFTY